jgi:adenylate cyclase
MDSREELLRSGIEALETTLLGGPFQYSRGDVAAKSGMPDELNRMTWQALGFTTVDDEVLAFTDGDIKALHNVRELISTGFVDPEMLLAIGRFMGRTLSRLAQTEVELVVNRSASLAAESEAPGDMLAKELGLLTSSLTAAEELLVYVWRRHMAAAAARALRPLTSDSTRESTDQAVGFADLESFTSLTRTLDREELQGLINRFEQFTGDAVTANGGRVVKTVGDEVMFVADDLTSAAEIALALAEPPDDLPRMSVGVAYGPVLPWLGDVFGEVVNIAARLCGLANAGTVLIDRQIMKGLSGHEAYKIRKIPRQKVRGYSNLLAATLRRRDHRERRDPRDEP